MLARNSSRGNRGARSSIGRLKRLPSGGLRRLLAGASLDRKRHERHTLRVRIGQNRGDFPSNIPLILDFHCFYAIRFGNLDYVWQSQVAGWIAPHQVPFEVVALGTDDRRICSVTQDEVLDGQL